MSGEVAADRNRPYLNWPVGTGPTFRRNLIAEERKQTTSEAKHRSIAGLENRGDTLPLANAQRCQSILGTRVAHAV